MSRRAPKHDPLSVFHPLICPICNPQDRPKAAAEPMEMTLPTPEEMEAQRKYEEAATAFGRRGSIDNPGATRVGAHAPATSLAAVFNLPDQGTKRRICYDLIKEAGERGLCDHEIEAKTGWLHQSASACRNSLMKDGHVKAGEHRRKTPSGNESIAWVTT